ncbi:MAG: glyoxalase [Bacteroidota bacterium]
MKYESLSVRTFVGSRDYDESRDFYRKMEFTELELGSQISYFKINESHGFYLQKYYVKDWVENSMIFVELSNLDEVHQSIAKKRLQDQYDHVKLSEIKSLDWGREFFLHDPSGVLWHFGEFN